MLEGKKDSFSRGGGGGVGGGTYCTGRKEGLGFYVVAFNNLGHDLDEIGIRNRGE